MCISANASIFTFIFSVCSSIILILYGNKKYKKENLVIGLIMIYVALMQISEYFMWIDKNNKKGYNKLASQFGAFFNYTQPIMFYIINYFVNYAHNIFVDLMNLIYSIYFLFSYNNFLKSNEVVTYVVNGHLKWNWPNYFNIMFYFIVLVINMIFVYQKNIPYLLLVSSIFFGTLIFSSIKYTEHIGELWCYIIANFPLVVCGISYLI
jgi:hypothetical protein